MVIERNIIKDERNTQLLFKLKKNCEKLLWNWIYNCKVNCVVSFAARLWITHLNMGLLQKKDYCNLINK